MKRRIEREWQVRDENGCLDHFPATVAGLKQAFNAYNEALNNYHGDIEEDEDDCPRLELYQQYQYRFNNEEDWEQEDCEHYQLNQRMPTKKLQNMINKYLD